MKIKRLVIVTGNYGSGKSEFSVNFIQWMAAQNRKVKIIDLDIVNPYFRSREARADLEEKGIEVIAPRGEQSFAELPIILPEVKGAIQNENAVVLLDVGGDPEGARVLSSFAPTFKTLRNNYELLFVANACRPFTEDVQGTLKILHEIEDTAKMKVTGIVSNAHLIDETTVDVIKNGYEISRQVAEELKVEFKCVTAHERFRPAFGDDYHGVSMFYIRRLLLAPWQIDEAVGSQNFSLRNRKFIN